MALLPLDKSLVMLSASDDISSEKKYKNARKGAMRLLTLLS
jgi:hypothetical protein